MAQTLASISALLLSVSLLVLGHGLQSTLLPLAASQAAFTDLQIGLISSAYFIGMVLGCLGAPHVIMRAGHIRAYAAMVSLMSAAAILHPILVEPVAWFAIRVISGFCLAAFYMIVESWLNERASNENRGMVMSVYVVVLFGSLMMGQVSISIMDINSFIPFAIASVVVSLAVMPVALTTTNQPAPIALVQFRPVKLYRNSPAAMVGCLLIGIANGALLTLTPLYGSQIGLSTEQSAFYAAAIIGGGMLSQWPIGRLSDSMDRRYVLMGLGAFTAASSLAIVLIAPTGFYAAAGLAIVVGVFSQPAYAIATAHGYDYADPEDFVETSSGLLLAFGIGSVGGPLTASILMERVGPSGLYMMVIVVELAMVAFIMTRIFSRSSLTQDEKTDFEYATTAQVGTVLSSEPLDVDADNVIAPEEFPAYEDMIYSPEAEEITEEVILVDDGDDLDEQDPEPEAEGQPGGQEHSKQTEKA
ncbi:putative MFS family arabinose efflux permease [Roseibium hamelinense]|uniref:Putative MFS family arabinose efflux permease n=1 Tax=Roseibium hamelinense TaxID=150831 RepID=A0A562STG1_9HYPH|nr:MFS transporter [Roseibium hamelinense]MTI42700.1 MFS transporter [Roseibium hamelinense]TWI84579.1 putative MFS family arabinose efflux permease [Roseibium hamelinense]